MTKIDGKRVIVTGASAGIGYETAKLFAAKGAKVVAVARRGERLERLAQECQGLAGEVMPLVADLSKESEARRMVWEGAEKLGGLDILINNAGVSMVGEVAEADMRLWRLMMEVNYFSVAAAIQEALPHLRRTKGAQIINVSSAVGQRSMPGSAAYCSTKFALNGLTEGLRAELAPEGIRVILVHPGLTKTEVFGALLEVKPIPKTPPPGLWGLLHRSRSAIRRGAPAKKAARTILRASVHNSRDAYVHWGDHLAVLFTRAFPRLTDRLVVGLYGKRG